MIWGQGDASGLRVVDTKVGRVGALACWEHFNPLARYALMAEHEQIHVAMFPGSLVGKIFRQQIEVTIRHHALESGCFVVNATGYLTEQQVRQVARDTGLDRALMGGCYTSIVSPEGVLLCEPLEEGEGMVIAELDFSQESTRMNRSLPLLPTPSTKQPTLCLPEVPVPQLLAELQSFGLRWTDRGGTGLARKGGAGPSDFWAYPGCTPGAPGASPA